jgi:hypothetical protein
MAVVVEGRRLNLTNGEVTVNFWGKEWNAPVGRYILLGSCRGTRVQLAVCSVPSMRVPSLNLTCREKSPCADEADYPIRGRIADIQRAIDVRVSNKRRYVL